MMRISILLFIYLLFITATHIKGMEVPTKSDWQHLFILPEELLLNIIAYCECKDKLRQTCKYSSKLVLRKNEKILENPLLRLSDEALQQFAVYHTALGNTQIVLNLLNKGAHKAMTLMHYAAGCGYLTIVDALLKHPDLDKKRVTEIGNSPLDLAIKHDQDRVVQHILATCESECSIAAFKKRGLYAIKNNAFKVMNVLTEKLATIPEQTENAKQFLTEFVDMKQKISNQIRLDITSGTTIGKTKLEECILYYSNVGDTEMVRTLLAQNIVIEENGEPITKKINGGKLLRTAACEGHLNVVRTLLDCNIDPNSMGKNGVSALHDTMMSNEITILPIMQLLIAKGALVDKGICSEKIASGATPLHFAAMQKHILATQLLIDSGADVTIKTDDGITALHAAAEANCFEIIEMLINNGADVNAQDATKKTPLHYIKKYNTQSLGILLAHPDINVNIQDIDGNTPLHLAVLGRDLIMVNELLEHLSISMNIQNNDKKTALDLASCNTTQALKDLLIEKGAKTHHQLIIKSIKKSTQESCTIQ